MVISGEQGICLFMGKLERKYDVENPCGNCFHSASQQPDLVSCPINSAHKMPASSLENHLRLCPSIQKGYTKRELVGNLSHLHHLMQKEYLFVICYCEFNLLIVPSVNFQEEDCSSKFFYEKSSTVVSLDLGKF